MFERTTLSRQTYIYFIVTWNGDKCAKAPGNCDNRIVSRLLDSPYFAPLLWTYKVLVRDRRSHRLRSRCECKNGPHEWKKRLDNITQEHPGPHTRPASPDPAYIIPARRAGRGSTSFLTSVPRKMNKIERRLKP